MTEGERPDVGRWCPCGASCVPCANPRCHLRTGDLPGVWKEASASGESLRCDGCGKPATSYDADGHWCNECPAFSNRPHAPWDTEACSQRLSATQGETMRETDSSQGQGDG
jgi:hypothetical protein